MYTVLKRLTALREHTFWPADLSLTDAISEIEPILGHRQIIDAYLLGLSRANGGILATLDRGILSLSDTNEEVELLGDV
jgi:predicted nucleic acid-binding protein